MESCNIKGMGQYLTNILPTSRCVYLRSATSEHADSEDWVDFINKMKDGIITSFDSQVQQYQEDTRRLDLQRQMPGWNYCTFFILKVRFCLSIFHTIRQNIKQYYRKDLPIHLKQ
jgi:hypothetical protein